MRNALNPVITVIALEFGTLFSGALITETVFSYPGMEAISLTVPSGMGWKDTGLSR